MLIEVYFYMEMVLDANTICLFAVVKEVWNKIFKVVCM